MKIRKPLSALVTLATALVAFALLADAAGAVAGVPVWRLTSKPSYGPTAPRISGSKVVWAQWGFTRVDTVVDDISTGAHRVIARNATWVSRISGDNIVWGGDQSASAPIYMYNLSTSRKKQIGAGLLESGPVISGNYVAWAQASGSSESQVYLYRIDTGVATKITASHVPKGDVAVGGNRIGWVETSTSGHSTSIITHDITSSVETTLTTSPGYLWGLNMEPTGRSLVWTNEVSAGVGSDDDVYHYEFASATQRRLTANASDQYQPAVYGNRVVWADERASTATWLNADIHVFDLVTRVERRLTDGATFHYTPDIYRNKVIWGDVAYGEDVMLADISRLDMTGPVARMMTIPYSTRDYKTGTFRVRWTGSDPNPSEGGIVAWNVQVKTGSSGTWSYLRSNTKDTYAYINGRPGHTYYFRVRAKDKAGIWGNWSTVRSTTVPWDDRSASAKVGFSGLWASSRSEHFLGTIRYSGATSDTVDFSFRGSRVAFITDTAPNHSEANIYIDGVFQKKVDTYEGGYAFRQVMYEKAFPVIGSHKLTVENVGTPGRKRLDVDAFAVIN